MTRNRIPNTDATDLQLRELEKRLRQVAAAEQQTTADTIEAALKTAKLGMELRSLLVNEVNNLQFLAGVASI